MISLEVTDKYKDDLLSEMYANEKCIDEFLDNDVVKAYYFGYLLDVVYEEFSLDGFKLQPASEKVAEIYWRIRKYKPQLDFWIDKYIKNHCSYVELNSYVLNKVVVEFEQDLIDIAIVIGYKTALSVQKMAKEGEEKMKMKIE